MDELLSKLRVLRRARNVSVTDDARRLFATYEHIPNGTGPRAAQVAMAEEVIAQSRAGCNEWHPEDVLADLIRVRESLVNMGDLHGKALDAFAVAVERVEDIAAGLVVKP